MKIYKKLYLYLFNKVTHAIRMLEQQRYEEAKVILIDAQRTCEELYMESIQCSK